MTDGWTAALILYLLAMVPVATLAQWNAPRVIALVVARMGAAPPDHVFRTTMAAMVLIWPVSTALPLLLGAVLSVIVKAKGTPSP